MITKLRSIYTLASSHIPRTRLLIAACILASAVAGFVGAITPFFFLFVLLIPFLGLAGRLLILWIKSQNDFFSPVFALGSVLILMYPVKAIYVLWSGRYGPYVALGGNYNLPLTGDSMPDYLWALSVASIGGGVFFLIAGNRSSPKRDGGSWAWAEEACWGSASREARTPPVTSLGTFGGMA